jgi:hypothetical protein
MNPYSEQGVDYLQTAVDKLLAKERKSAQTLFY